MNNFSNNFPSTFLIQVLQLQKDYAQKPYSKADYFTFLRIDFYIFKFYLYQLKYKQHL